MDDRGCVVTSRRLTRPGVLIVEFQGCKRCLVIESTCDGLTLARTGKATERSAIDYDALTRAITGKTLKEYLR